MTEMFSSDLERSFYDDLYSRWSAVAKKIDTTFFSLQPHFLLERLETLSNELSTLSSSGATYSREKLYLTSFDHLMSKISQVSSFFTPFVASLFDVLSKHITLPFPLYDLRLSDEENQEPIGKIFPLYYLFHSLRRFQEGSNFQESRDQLILNTTFSFLPASFFRTFLFTTFFIDLEHYFSSLLESDQHLFGEAPTILEKILLLGQNHSTDVFPSEFYYDLSAFVQSLQPVFFETSSHYAYLLLRTPYDENDFWTSLDPIKRVKKLKRVFSFWQEFFQIDSLLYGISFFDLFSENASVFWPFAITQDRKVSVDLPPTRNFSRYFQRIFYNLPTFLKNSIRFYTYRDFDVDSFLERLLKSSNMIFRFMPLELFEIGGLFEGLGFLPSDEKRPFLMDFRLLEEVSSHDDLPFSFRVVGHLEKIKRAIRREIEETAAYFYSVLSNSRRNNESFNKLYEFIKEFSSMSLFPFLYAHASFYSAYFALGDELAFISGEERERRLRFSSLSQQIFSLSSQTKGRLNSIYQLLFLIETLSYVNSFSYDK